MKTLYKITFLLSLSLMSLDLAARAPAQLLRLELQGQNALHTDIAKAFDDDHNSSWCLDNTNRTLHLYFSEHADIAQVEIQFSKDVALPSFFKADLESRLSKERLVADVTHNTLQINLQGQATGHSNVFTLNFDKDFLKHTAQICIAELKLLDQGGQDLVRIYKKRVKSLHPDAQKILGAWVDNHEMPSRSLRLLADKSFSFEYIDFLSGKTKKIKGNWRAFKNTLLLETIKGKSQARIDTENDSLEIHSTSQQFLEASYTRVQPDTIY
jgi:hypothetical protein